MKTSRVELNLYRLIGEGARAGSARLQRAGFGILPKRSFVTARIPERDQLGMPDFKSSPAPTAPTGTLQACAPRRRRTPTSL